MTPTRIPLAALLLLLPWSLQFAASPILHTEFLYETAPFPQCHASTLAETSAGTLVASFFGGTHERHPDVRIWVSRRMGGRWTTPVAVADGIQHTKIDGSVVRHPTWNPVLFQPSKGPLLLFYKVGPSPQSWWGMLTTSHDDGVTWSEPRRLPEGVLGPIKNRPVELPGGVLLCPSSWEETHDDGWTVHFERTADWGRTWTVTPPVSDPPRFNAIQPSILIHADGRLQALCRSMKKVMTETWSHDGGRTWGEMSATNLRIPNSGSDAVTLADGRYLLVYNPLDVSSDDPKTWGVRYPLEVAISADGLDWRKVLTLETEPRKDGYAYPTVIQARDGRVHLSYTWDRRRIKYVVLDPAELKSVSK